MTDTSLVRPVKPEDRDGLLDLLRMRHAEFGLGAWDRDRAGATLQLAIDGTGTIFAGVVAGPAHPEATIGLALARWWDEADFHLEALWDYVHPDHRTTLQGATEHTNRLHRFAMLCADRLGMPVYLGGPIRGDSQGKVKAYCRHFRPAGAFFTYGGEGWKRMSKSSRTAMAEGFIKAFEGSGP